MYKLQTFEVMALTRKIVEPLQFISLIFNVLYLQITLRSFLLLLLFIIFFFCRPFSSFFQWPPINPPMLRPLSNLKNITIQEKIREKTSRDITNKVTKNWDVRQLCFYPFCVWQGLFGVQKLYLTVESYFVKKYACFINHKRTF